MGVRDLFFAIKARDETGAAFGAVKNNLRSVDGMAATASQKLQRMGRGLIGFGAAATAATAPIMFAFRDSLALYDQQERAQAKVAQGVRSTGQAAGFSADELFRHASALQSLTRIGDEEILNGVTAQLLTFTNIAGDQFLRAQTAALDMATVLDSDLSSASIMLGKALNDPVKGLSAMSRAGVTFSEDQAKVIKALAETGDVAAAQVMILEELERQYGGQAKAAAEAGLGAMDQLSNSWGDLKETVGGVLAEILPPMVDFFKSVVAGFQSLPEPTQKFTVAIGLMAAVAGPAAIVLGGLTLAIGAISGPVTLAALGIAGVVGVLAALWPQAQNTTNATDDLTRALGDEITQSQLLSQALGVNGTISVEIARVKLSEARARHENVAAIIAEHRALALSSGAYVDLTRKIEDQQAALNATGFPAIDAAVPARADAFEAAQQRLADLLVERQRLLDADGDLVEQLQRTEENIRTLEESLENAENGVASFGGSIVSPIAPGERLNQVLDEMDVNLPSVGAGARSLADDLEGLTQEAEETKDVLDGFGTETATMLKDMFADGKLTLRDFGDFVLAWGDRLLDRFLTAVFDPLGNMIQNLFDQMLSGGNLFGGLFGGSGGGGLVGGLVSVAGNLLGFDTGGEMEVTGRNGIDRNVAAFRVSADENIKVVKRGNPDGGRPVNVYIQTPDPAAFKASRGQIAAQIGRAVGRGARFT